MRLSRRGAIFAANQQTAAAGYYTEVLADSPIGLWKLDETSGATASDSSGFSRDATYYGPTLNQTGPSAQIPKAVNGDGVDDHAVSARLAAFDIASGDNWAMEVWTKTTSTATVRQPLSWRDTTAYGDTTSDRRSTTGIILGNYPDAGKVGFLVPDNQAATQNILAGSAAVGFNDGGWHHLVLTAESGGSVRLYMDATQVVASSNTRSSWTGDDRNMLALGNVDADGTVIQFFPGDLAAVAFYSTYLTPSRIQAHYDAAGVA